MAIMNPSKLRDILDLLPCCNLSDTKKKAIEAIITKYLNGEIVPVVHGRWEKFNLGIYDFALRLRCSNCQQAVYENGFNYCPNCGAKMDGED